MPSAETPAGRVLFIDDDADVLKAGALVLKRHGFAVATIQNPDAVWAAMAETPPDAILLDLNFSPGARSGEEGLETLRRIVAHDPDAVVLVVTGHSGVGIAVSAMRSGAADFIMKPWNNDRLATALTDAVALRHRRRNPDSGKGVEGLILGASPAADRLRGRVARLASSAANVLILGEPGAGKTLAAQAIHAGSPVRDHSLTTLDLAGLSPEIQVARLTDLSASAAGTLLLRSVGALAPEAFAPLQTLIDAPTPTRILATALDAGEITHWPDRLRFGLTGAQLPIPSLRARRGDIPELAGHFARQAARSAERTALSFTAEAEVWLTGANWPGNIRELKARVEQAVLLADGEIYGVADLAPSREPDDVLPPVEPGDDLNLDRQERRLVEAALKRRSFNISHAAEDLGLTRAALYRRMEKHGL